MLALVCNINEAKLSKCLGLFTGKRTSLELFDSRLAAGTGLELLLTLFDPRRLGKRLVICRGLESCEEI